MRMNIHGSMVPSEAHERAMSGASSESDRRIEEAARNIRRLAAYRVRKLDAQAERIRNQAQQALDYLNIQELLETKDPHQRLALSVKKFGIHGPKIARALNLATAHNCTHLHKV